MILQLIDGAIQEITSDAQYNGGGCPTCDYGAEYVSEYIITMNSGKIYIEATQKDSFPLTEGYMMTLLLPNVDKIKNMKEKEFYEWLNENMKNDVGSIRWNDM